MPAEEKYLHKYRIPSNRLPGYDYSSNGLYFVTICAKNRENYFGEINQGIMALSAIGKITEEELLETPTIRPNVNIDTWVIMPNHVHVIVGIDNQKTTPKPIMVVETHCNASLQHHGASLQQRPNYKNTFGPQINNLSSIIRAFKGAVVRRTKKQNINNFAWQARFHDHIIKDSQSLTNIRRYIADNPIKWADDELYNRLN